MTSLMLRELQLKHAPNDGTGNRDLGHHYLNGHCLVSLTHCFYVNYFFLSFRPSLSPSLLSRGIYFLQGIVTGNTVFPAE